MIVNARMYSVSPQAEETWRELLTSIGVKSGMPVSYLEYAAPAPLEVLWQRSDMAAVFMCGLPFARARPPPILVAAPVPSPAEFGAQPCYWSDWVVRADSPFRTVSDTFGGRLALTVPGSQSGCIAALRYFMAVEQDAPSREAPLFGEIIAPTITPLGALCAVIRGEADIAPIDAYAFRLLQRYRPDLTDRVRAVDRTLPTPIPPLVASAPDVEPLRAALLEAHENASTQVLMQALLLRGFVRVNADAYRALREGFDAATTYWASRSLAAATHPAFVL
jgi:ABC-type phosphate/phosphonate transport system substrate-binding protein